MPESFLGMSASDRREALNFVASQTGRPANLLEKDVWVVQALDVLHSSRFGPHLVFKAALLSPKCIASSTAFQKMSISPTTSGNSLPMRPPNQ